MKIVSIVGARPQFIKAAVVSPALESTGCHEYLIHTGQHYDFSMSDIFFQELTIPTPAVNLGVGSGSHGSQTAEMLWRLEQVLMDQMPDLVLLYGDTNSTLAGALAAVKLQIPAAHVEAGPRDYLLSIPEELNRIVADRASALNFCATKSSVENLKREGIRSGVYLTGDVMLDIFQRFEPAARNRIALLERLGLAENEYVLATFHRPENVGQTETLLEIMRGLSECGYPVVFPVHPRTQKEIRKLPQDQRFWSASAVKLIDPLGYLDLVCLELFSRCVITDSGGVQREAYFAAKPCITVYLTISWPETVEEGWNRVVPPKSQEIIRAIQMARVPGLPGKAFGDGTAAIAIATLIRQSIESGITVDGFPANRDTKWNGPLRGT